MGKEGETYAESEISEANEIESSGKKKKIIIFILLFLIVLIVVIVLIMLFVRKLPNKKIQDVAPQNNFSADHNTTNETCLEKWECTNWTSCINNTQERNCTDSNNCNTILNKPLTTMTCSNSSNNTCEEKFLVNEEHQCIGIELVQRKWQNSDCTVEWKEFTYCPTDRKCNVNASNPQVCELYSCEESAGLICSQNQTCEGNTLKATSDTEKCCLTSCLNATG